MYIWDNSGEYLTIFQLNSHSKALKIGIPTNSYVLYWISLIL